MTASPSTGPPARADHELGWKLQRVAWAAGVVVLALSLAGLLGGERAGRREAVSPDGLLHVEYDRYCRSGKPSVFVVHLGPGPRDGLFSIDFLGAIPDRFLIREITPGPVRSELLPGGVRLHFAAAVADAAGTAGAVIQIRGDALGPGTARCAFAARDGAARVDIRQFIYP